MNQSTRCLSRTKGVLSVEGGSLGDDIKIEPGRWLVVQRQSGSARSIVARLSQTARIGTADGGSSTVLWSCIWAHESRDCLSRDTLRDTGAERIVTSGKPVLLHRNTGLNSLRRSKLGSGSNMRGEGIGSAICGSGKFIEGSRRGKNLTNLVRYTDLRREVGHRANMLGHAIGATHLGDIAIGIGMVASIVGSLNLVLNLVLILVVVDEALGVRLSIALSIVLNIGVGICCTRVAIVAMIGGGLDS